MEDLKSLLNQAQKELENGQSEKARVIVENRRTVDLHDPDQHLRWADLCEELGMIDDVILELNFALRDQPGNVTLHQRLAEIHRDNGNLEKSARKWKEVVELQPGASNHYLSYGAILEEIKDYEKASEIYRKGLEKTGDAVFKARLKAIEFVSGNVEEFEKIPRTEEDWIPADSQVVRFMDLFSGREGVYARQWVSSTGESGYTPIREPFTLGVAKNHLMGNHTIGLYPLRMDNTVCFIAFDIDIAKFFLSKAITSKKLWERAENMAQAFACKIVDMGAAHQIPVYLEDSGFKGRHCWIFLETPIPARIARRFALLMVQQLGRPPSELQVESFPKQAFVEEGKLGNLIKIPLGIHRKTGRRGLFIDAAGKAIPNQLGFLERIEKISKQKIYEFIQRFQISDEIKIPAQEQVSSEDLEKEKKAKSSLSLPAVPDDYNLERDAEFQYLISKCHVLRIIVEKINQDKELNSEERIVLTHSVGLLQHGPEAINLLLGRCVNVDASFFLKSRLRGNPISCPKIRSRVPNITTRVECNCKFDPKTTLYPSPLLHVQEMDRIKSDSFIGKTVDSLQFQQLLQEYLKARKQIREIEILTRAYEDRLDEFFSQAGIDSVQTPMGTLKRIKGVGEKASYHLEL
jgi:hypothetical protein